MMYSVKEIYYTLQGEGAHTGRPAVFLRFSGCNLWTGREQDRPKAVCRFCDTDFVGTDGPGGGTFKRATSIAQAVEREWRNHAHTDHNRYVVCTGGEPLLQLDEAIIEALHDLAFEVGVETNGTKDVPASLDWVCLSPKAGAPLRLAKGDELKLVFPQPDAMPEQFEDFEFEYFFLQPMDGPALRENTRAAIEYCIRFPKWRLSIQTHKYLDIP